MANESNQMDPELPGESGGDAGAELEDLLSSLQIDTDSDTGEEASQDVAEESGPKEETFYDATKVPDELRPTFREMQSALTKKTQFLADKERRLDSLLGKTGNIEEVGYKAQILDGLLENPKVVKFLEKLNAGDVDYPEEEDPETELLDRRVKQAVEPLRRELSEHKQRLAAEQSLAQFKRAHSDWEKYQTGMEQAWRANKSLDLEGAYRWAVYEAAKERRKVAANSDKSVERGMRASLPATSSNSTVKVDSVDDALRLAFREKGLKFSS